MDYLKRWEMPCAYSCIVHRRSVSKCRNYFRVLQKTFTKIYINMPLRGHQVLFFQAQHPAEQYKFIFEFLQDRRHKNRDENTHRKNTKACSRTTTKLRGKTRQPPNLLQCIVQSLWFFLHLIFFICIFLNRFSQPIPADSLPLASVPEAVSRGNGRLVYYDQRHPSHSSSLGASLAVSAPQTLPSFKHKHHPEMHPSTTTATSTSTTTLAPPSPPPPAGL